jgi:hypothetical protein
MSVFVLLRCVVLLVHLKVDNVCVRISNNVEPQETERQEKEISIKKSG